MRVVLRPDTHVGLTGPQMLEAAGRLRMRESALREAATIGNRRESASALRDASAMAADIPVWESAGRQLGDQPGKWAIDWSQTIREADWAPESVLREFGARNSKMDMGHIQKAHDAMHALGAQHADDPMDPEAETAEDPNEPTDPNEPVDPNAQQPMPMQPGQTAPPMPAVKPPFPPRKKMPAMPVRESLVTMDGSPSDVRFSESTAMSDELVTLAEAAAEFDDTAREVWITPIRPGFGNKRDGFYYPVDTVREAVASGQFDNVKMFANHPSKSGEKDLPERSVVDWVGVIKETRWDDQRQVPRSRVAVLDDAVYAKWKRAPEHVAFSVLGAGVARPGHVNGQSARIVESVKGIKSVDWVTQAGAGGGIDFRESAAEEFDMDLKNMTVAQLREAVRERPDLLAALREADEPTPQDEPDEDPSEVEPAGVPAPDGYVTRAEYDALAASIAAIDAESVREASEADAAAIVRDALDATTLPAAARDYLTRAFAEATVGEGWTYSTEDELREAVGSETVQMERVLGRTKRTSVRGLGASEETSDRPATLRESKESSLLERLTRSDALPSALSESGVEATAPKGAVAASVAARMSSRGL